MNWTEDQITTMRTGRPEYRNDVQGLISWVRTSEETDGEYSLLYAEASAGSTVFPHFHTLYEETFHVLEGVLELRVAGDSHRLEAGQEVTVPLRAVHQWRNPTEGTTRFMVKVRPAHAVFEKWLVVAAGLVADGKTAPDGRPKNPYHGALILVESDIHLVGVGRLLMPMMHLLARAARRKGIDRQLEEHYYRQG
ncbi:cupin domain-containing protein [Kocuria aegyptia]